MELSISASQLKGFPFLRAAVASEPKDSRASKVEAARPLYYRVPRSNSEFLSAWGLPAHLPGALVVDDRMRSAIDRALNLALSGKPVALLGEPGVGKTTTLYALWLQASSRSDLDAARLLNSGPYPGEHADLGVLLLYDDLPRNPERARELATSGVGMVVATTRTAEPWARC